MSLDTILADVEAQLDVTVEMDSALRSNGTLKTWYYSFQGRSTGGGDTPANTEFPAYLRGVGPLSQSLAEDMLFSGLAANNPGSIILVQPLPEAATDQLSQLSDYTFTGYQVRIKIGRVTDAYSAFELLRTTVVSLEPIISLTADGLQAGFGLAGALARLLEENLLVDRYLGIPHCLKILTGTGVGTATHISAYDLLSFTLMMKFKIATLQSSDHILLRKATGIGNRNFTVYLKGTGSGGGGEVTFLVSFVGVGSDTAVVASTTQYVDDAWHNVVCGLLDKTTAYMLIDDVLIGTYSPSASVNTQTEPITCGFSGNTVMGSILDVRGYNRYIAPDDARALSAVRADGDDTGVVFMWRCDDNTGSVANDYSSNNNDMSIAGVLNTDFSWQPSDLGEPELAGRPMPIVVGEVLNAQAHLIDGARERYRTSDRAIYSTSPASNTALTVRARGTLLTGGGTDYSVASDGGDGVLSMTVAEDEPVTFDLLYSGTSERDFYAPKVASDLLTRHTRLTTSNINTQQRDTIAIGVASWLAGYHTDVDSTAQAALREILGESGLAYYEDVDGKLFIDMVLPPVGYGPYGEPCLAFPSGGVVLLWGDIGDVTGSCTLACWYKTSAVGHASPFADPATTDNTLIFKDSNYGLYHRLEGADGGKLIFEIKGTGPSTSSVTSPLGILQPDVWYFIAGVFDATADTMKLYCAALGGTLIEVASATGATTTPPAVPTGDLQLGLLRQASVGFRQVWNTTKTLGELSALMATPPVGNEANLVAYAKINEGSGLTVTDQTAAVDATFTAGSTAPRWSPKLVIDLNDTPSVTLSEFHRAAPAAEVVVHYARNRLVMTDADIDTGVTQNNRLNLTRQWKDISLENADIRTRYKFARKIVMDSSITDRDAAQRLAVLLRTRVSEDRYIGKLTFPNDPEAPLNISRLACGIAIGDEIGITATIPSQLATARSFRAVAVAPNPLTLNTTIVFWG